MKPGLPIRQMWGVIAECPEHRPVSMENFNEKRPWFPQLPALAHFGGR
jgi:hypothetical protein